MRAVSGEPTVKVGPLTIDLAARAVMLNGARLTLTPKEYRLLQVLAQHAGKVLTHRQLLKEVWGHPQWSSILTCASLFSTCGANWKTTPPGPTT